VLLVVGLYARESCEIRAGETVRELRNDPRPTAYFGGQAGAGTPALPKSRPGLFARTAPEPPLGEGASPYL